MRKITARQAVLGLAFILALMGTSEAGNSVSLQVSCTIPAVPGLNVPLLENNNIVNNIPVDLTPAKTESDKTLMRAETAQDSTGRTIQTIYSR